jgi:hypothetical protein
MSQRVLIHCVLRDVYCKLCCTLHEHRAAEGRCLLVLRALSELHEHCKEFDPPVAMYNAVAAMTRQDLSGKQHCISLLQTLLCALHTTLDKFYDGVSC